MDLQRLADNQWKAGGGAVVEGKILYNREVTTASAKEAVAGLYINIKG